MSIKLEIPRNATVMRSIAQWLNEQANIAEGVDVIKNAVCVAEGQPIANDVPTPPPEPVASTTQDLDSTGTPWDARIHSSSRALVKDGTWRYKKGADKDLINQLETEWRNETVAANPVGDVVKPDVEDLFKVPEPPAANEPFVPEPPAANEPVTFVQLAELLGKLGAQGGMMPDTMEQLTSPYGIAGFGDLGMNPEHEKHFPAIKAKLESLLK